MLDMLIQHIEPESCSGFLKHKEIMTRVNAKKQQSKTNTRFLLIEKH